MPKQNFRKEHDRRRDVAQRNTGSRRRSRDVTCRDHGCRNPPPYDGGYCSETCRKRNIFFKGDEA